VRAVKLLVKGRVQGVGFRWFAREEARRAGLAGWVRNAADGTVEIAAAGDADSVERFIEAVRRGPPGSRVDGVDCAAIAPEAPVGRPFSIRR
jgi:acylphosphatase